MYPNWLFLRMRRFGYLSIQLKYGDDIPTVIDSTASPYKFSASVLNAVLAGKAPKLDEFAMVDELHKVTGADIPKPLASLKDKSIRFENVCNKEDMSQMVFKLLNL